MERLNSIQSRRAATCRLRGECLSLIQTAPLMFMGTVNRTVGTAHGTVGQLRGQ